MSENKLPKKAGRKKIYTGDYTQEYKDHKRCKNCNRPTIGIDDFKNIRTGTITKTCKKCRARVYKSYTKIKDPTQKEIIEALYKVIGNIHEDVLKTAIKDNKDLKKFIDKFIEH